MIMRIGSFLVALGIVALSATRMAAQTCAGAASFSSGPIRLGAALASGDGVKSYGVTMGVGSKDNPLFAQGHLGRAEYSDVDANGTLVGLGAGYAIDVNPTKTVQFCPIAAFNYQSGPDIDFGTSKISTTGRAFGIGGALGGTVPVSPTLDVVPFAAASYVLSRVSATLDGDTQSASKDYTEIDIGAGFVLNKTLTLQPAIAIPVGLDGAKSSFQLALSFNFGSQKH